MMYLLLIGDFYTFLFYQPVSYRFDVKTIVIFIIDDNRYNLFHVTI